MQSFDHIQHWLLQKLIGSKEQTQVLVQHDFNNVCGSESSMTLGSLFNIFLIFLL